MSQIASQTTAIATTKVKDKTTDEKLQRRRLQFKLHQRRHRAKQKQKVTMLDCEVQSLTAEVKTLHHERCKLVMQHNWFSSRGTAGGGPARVAMEYFRLFQVSAYPLHLDQQERFLRATMTSETAGPDYLGVDTIITQWRRFCKFFAYIRYVPLTLNITTVGDTTVVEVDSIFSIGGRRDGILALYPSLKGDMELTQKLTSNIINIHCKYRFTFDSNELVTWFSAEWDLVNALQEVLADLSDVSTVLLDANISSSTGQIKVDDIHATESKLVIDPRHNVEFLLS
ncbi:hypothetical protein CCR75_003192 [Bremia lactucae]|uniref:BZIP domain-containing protein n=1 Tax=Bremia lactucae TaxID=4779 RepID=A0A976FM80_BRELC|nr:hypothetical protein CCR75_003192 [Bremia lactucae]